MLNKQVAEQLREIGRLLEKQKANPFRIRAYFNAAVVIDELEKSVQDIIEHDGIKGLIELPNIGEGIARSIYEFVATGRMTRLESLKGESDPIALLRTVPGIGRALAERIFKHLHIKSLEALEMAIRNGRLANIPGLGDKRLKAIRSWLVTVLGERRPNLRQGQHIDHEPPLALLLKLDEDYRRKAAAGTLPTIAPKRFNPDGKDWLPILHSTQSHWHFTLLYSNSALAHELDRTHDWVVIYFYDDHHQEGQHTIVTETRGPLQGKRVVRGREMECREYYDQRES
jgi:putative hydrolase